MWKWLTLRHLSPCKSIHAILCDIPFTIFSTICICPSSSFLGSRSVEGGNLGEGGSKSSYALAHNLAIHFVLPDYNWLFALSLDLQVISLCFRASVWRLKTEDWKLRLKLKFLWRGWPIICHMLNLLSISTTASGEQYFLSQLWHLTLNVHEIEPTSLYLIHW